MAKGSDRKAKSKASEQEAAEHAASRAKYDAWQEVMAETKAIDLVFWAHQKAQDEWQDSGDKRLEAAARILHALSKALEDEQTAEAFKAPNEWAARYLREKLEARGEHVVSAYPHGTLDRSVDGRLDKKAEAARAFAAELTSIVQAPRRDNGSRFEALPKTTQLVIWIYKRMTTPLGAKLHAPIAPDVDERLSEELERIERDGKIGDAEEVFVAGLTACGMKRKDARNLADSAFRPT